MIGDFCNRLFWCLKKGFPVRMILCDVPLWDLPASTKFGHPYGITINQWTSIGENCSILSNVTIGQRRFENKRALIGKNVWIGSGAIILGPVTIGDNVTIAAGSIVLTDIPPNSVYISKCEHFIQLRQQQGEQL